MFAVTSEMSDHLCHDTVDEIMERNFPCMKSCEIFWLPNTVTTGKKIRNYINNQSSKKSKHLHGSIDRRDTAKFSSP
ncbi:hypothetical protein B5X24_HaOG208261 [Helicoverpa armigera]|uniref:Uncharacterized protein n=1 Tax=Helicoverpa armigera TaxID=29058 RepID=A0A2W1BG68_HELAM|nr:hypothetical protein B5X24_HaOG208261 [Helicoverpa armigera]